LFNDLTSLRESTPTGDYISLYFRNEDGGLDYNGILSYYDPVIDRYASIYEKNYDKRQDLNNRIRYKVWQSIENAYSTSKGTLEGWIIGVIRMESKKHVLDAPKYKQKYFEDNHNSLDNMSFINSSAYICYINEDLNEEQYREFLEDFSCFLNSIEKKVFDVMERSLCDKDSIVLYGLASVLGMTPSTLYLHSKSIENKLRYFARSRGYIIKGENCDKN